MNISAYPKTTLRKMLEDQAFKPYHAEIEAFLAPKPVQGVSKPAEELKPRDQGKTWHNVTKDLTCVVYSKGYTRLDSNRGNFIGLYKSDAEKLIAFLQEQINSGRITDRQS